MANPGRDPAAAGGIVALFALGKTQLALGAEDRLEDWLAGYRVGPWGLVAAVVVFTLSAFIAVPQFLLIAACVVAFGPWFGSSIAGSPPSPRRP
ncbi:hypothetical protein V8F63_11730 [Brevundimonas sp. LF-1]|uniref:hypothetical protein n=1 Tax=Brevundimonas sp. LF-1 TaxID=3126100 RepID=UPI0030E2ABAB